MGQALAAGDHPRQSARCTAGKASTLTTDQRGVYTGCPVPSFRYHSAGHRGRDLPGRAEVTRAAKTARSWAYAATSELAGSKTPMEGVQFHPESILSEHGHAMLKTLGTERPTYPSPTTKPRRASSSTAIFHDEMLTLMRRIALAGRCRP